ncbi:MAG: hypothetical protein OEZ32_06515 [Nitrospinota bacterium]|nr:hypothetical protein [Nitrospinota bacterium]
MSTNGRRIPPDNEGEEFDELLRDYEEADDSVGAYVLTEQTAGLIESLDEETLALSQRFQAIVSYVNHLSGFFDCVLKGSSDKEFEEAMDAISQGASALSKRYESAGSVIIRYRGRGSMETGEGAESHDFTVLTGRTLLDVSTLKNLVSIEKSEAYRLGEKMGLAFNPLPRLGIYMLATTFNTASQQDLYMMRSAFKALVKFMRLTSPAPSAPQSGDFLVSNEFGVPDPNLTMLAAINNIKAGSMQELVKKVAAMMREADPTSRLARPPTVYDAIFLDPKLRDRLKKPPVEVNNPRRMLADQADGALPSLEKAILLREAAGLYGDDPLKAARTMDCLFLRDYRDVNSMEMVESIYDVDEFIKKARTPSLVKVALTRIREKLDQAPDYLMDTLSFDNGGLTSMSGAMTEPEPLQADLMGIVSFFKQRSETNEKIHKILYEAVEFDNKDVRALAQDMGIGAEEAAETIELLRKCFKVGGHFSRGVFDKNIPFFAKHEKKMFQLLWGFLKDISAREDRVALLDSLQLLISKMRRPDMALDVILSDFVTFPEILDYSERNGLMLANVLMRKYNKELGNKIERTPEEVLLARAGISEEMAGSIANFIDREQDRFLRKMRTIHEELVACIGSESDDVDKMSLRFLVSMEREIYILLSLSGGVTGRRIIRSAVREYGDPHSGPYENVKNQDELKSILQLLQLAVRSLVRFGEKDDAPLFERIKQSGEEFLKSKPTLMPKETFRSVMEHVSAALRA